jgi:hypothetical protein
MINRSRRKGTRTAFAATLAGGLLLVLSVFGGIGFAKSPVPAQKQYEKKVTICHKGKNTISVGKPALKAHLKHGDTLGPCPSSSSSSSSTSKAKGKSAEAKGKSAEAKGKSAEAKGKSAEAPTPTATPAPASPGGSDQGHGKGKGKK